MVNRYLQETGQYVSALQRNYQIVADAFPAIGAKFKLFWGSQDFTDLVHDLIHSTRDETRKGFPVEVMTAFMDLEDLHNKVFPKFSQRSINPKSLNYRHLIED